MRYNPDTERGIVLEDIAAQGQAAILTLPKPEQSARVWDCQNGGWIDTTPQTEVEPAQAIAEDLAVIDATLNLWNARHKLQQIERGGIPAATVASLKRDVHDIARELQRLS